MIGYDCDGVLFPLKVEMPSFVQRDGMPSFIVVTGRTLGMYNYTRGQLRALFGTDTGDAIPLYIQPGAPSGSRVKAGQWKGTIARLAGLVKFYEDDFIQAAEIARLAPNCEVVLVK